MRNPAFYPHKTHTAQVIHTHISTIFLTGEFAYKIKKPVNFGFLDFTRLSDRKHFCEQEVALNSRLAPDLYLGVVPVLQTAGVYHLSTGTAATGQNIVEYAVKMRQFDPSQQLDRLLDAGLLQPGQMEELAGRIARFHAQAEIAPSGSNFGHPDKVMQPSGQNFRQLRQCLSQPALLRQLDRLEGWMQQCFDTRKNIFRHRWQNGFIRACHGDMHLGNMAIINGRMTLFDGIEFSEELRWIDIASDIAFVLMDLEDRRQPGWSRLMLNAWLTATGDFAALHVMKFYQCYRAMVRAKVNALRLAQLETEDETGSVLHHCANYLNLAESYTRPAQPALLITHGLSGSGKSWHCRQLVETGDFIQLRSDVERKRLAGMNPTGRGSVGLDEGIYQPDMSRRTYARLAELAEQVLQSGYSVVVDATFLQQAQRDIFRQLAKGRQIPFLILHFSASKEQLEANIKRRQAAGNDASDAGLEVLHRQLAAYKPLQDGEPYVKVQVNDTLPLERITAQIARLRDSGS